MGVAKGWLARWRAIVRGRAADRSLNEEIRFHIELETEKNIALGMSREEARRRALVAFGGREQVREAHRDVRGARWLEESLADARYAFRTLRRSPALMGAAIITLALGAGANTAIFSAVNAVLLQPLPFRDAGRLVLIGENNPGFNWHLQVAAPANYLDWRARVTAFRDVMAYADFSQPLTLVANGTPRLVMGALVTGNFFSVLGIDVERGRGFREDETWENGSPVAVVSDRLWREQLGADPRVIGSSISLDGRKVTVVGIAPRTFAFPWEETDLWTPLAWERSAATKVSFRQAHWLRPIARLRSGASIETANAELQQVAAALKREYPETNARMDAELAPLHDFLVGDTRLPLLVLLASVGLLLLIACANVGNLLLVHAAGREREIAVRVALGAGRARLIRQALTESLILSVLGGAAGIALGWWWTHVLVLLQPKDMLRVADFGVDWRVMGYVVATTTFSGLVFAIAPAAWRSRRPPGAALQAKGRGASDSAPMRRWAERLAIGEVAVALVLTVGAGLLVRSVARLRHVDPGFNADSVLTTTIHLPPTRYETSAKEAAFFAQVVERARGIHGAVDVAAVTKLPVTAPGWSSSFSIDGPSAGHFGVSLLHRQVTADYFRTMRVSLLRGRVFTGAERGPPYVVVINDVMARDYFKGQDPIGQRIAFDRNPDSTSTWRTIIGVVRGERQTSLAQPPEIEVFAPITQEESGLMTLVMRTAGDPVAYAPQVRRVVAELDPQLAIGAIRPMSDIRDEAMARDRFLMVLLSMFGAVGLALAVVGVYGVVAQLARGRTREMGIRLALGAPVSMVRWLVVRRGVALAGAGLLIGGTAALFATRALGRLLFEVAPSDPITFAIAGGALLATSVLASWLPAVRASRVDPVATLREE